MSRGGSCSPRRRPASVSDRRRGGSARWRAAADDVDAMAATSRRRSVMVAHLDAMVARHLGGEPLAYVLGRWTFRHVDLAVDARVLIPRPETEVVAGVAIELARTLPGPIVRRRPRHRFGGDRPRTGRRAARRRRDGVDHRRQRRRPRCRARQPRRSRPARRQRARRPRVVVRCAARGHVRSTWSVSNPPYVAAGSPDVGGVGRRVGAARGAVRRTRRARRHPRHRDRRRPDGCGPVAGWCSRSVPTRATPSSACSPVVATPTWRSGPTSPAATASPSREWRAEMAGLLASVRATERQRGSGYRRPAWPGNAVNSGAAASLAEIWARSSGSMGSGQSMPRPGSSGV